MKYVKSLDAFGVNAKEIPCIAGKDAPTTATEGAVGCLYMDMDTGDIHKCIKAENGEFTWTLDQFKKAKVSDPVLVLDGIEAETAPGYYWGPGGKVANPNYTAIELLIDVSPGEQYKLVNFSGAAAFYYTDGLDYFVGVSNLPVGGSYVSTELVFTVPVNKYKMALSMYMAQRLADIKLYRVTPSDSAPRTVYTKADFWVGKENIKDADMTAFLPLYGKKIVNFGDSIFGMYAPPSDISTRLANLTGATVYNCGFPGCRMAGHTLEAFKPFSMYKLAEAIASGDFTEQETALSTYSSTLTEGFTVSLNTLKAIDFDKVDIVTIAYGTNDWYGGVLLDHENYPTSYSPFASALRLSLNTLLGAYPNLRVFLCTPIYRFSYDATTGSLAWESDTHAIKDGWLGETHTLSEFADKVIEVGKAYHLPVIDNYYELGINSLNCTRYINAGDGTHPTGEGLELMARHIASKLY